MNSPAIPFRTIVIQDQCEEPDVYKVWHDHFQKSERNLAITKIVSSACGNSDPPSMRALMQSIDNAIALEKDLFEDADCPEEYYQMIAEEIGRMKQILRFGEEMGKKSPARRELVFLEDRIN